MIYFKKKSLIKKAISFISQKTQGHKPRVFSFSNCMIVLVILLFTLYSSYLFLTPKIVNDENVQKIINNHVLKNSKLTLDVPNLSVYPDYKFNIKIIADEIILKYPNNSVFVQIEKPDIEINLFSLINKYIDLNKIKTTNIQINTQFNKSKTYDCFKYFDNEKISSNFKLRNINLISQKFAFNLYDENEKKMFYLKSDDLKISSNEFKKSLSIKSKGTISSATHKISDFDLNLAIKISPLSAGKFKEKLFKLNYNPFKYADEYKFYAQSNIDLKINPQDKKSNVVGNVYLKDYNFIFEELVMPKNNLLLTFKDNKIYFDSDFKFIKNQQIKVKSTVGIEKNKFIEAKLSSNNINLADFRDVFSIFCEILNLKYKLNEIALFGNANIDLYLKSNFKTINSSGKLLIQNAKLHHKKLGLNIEKINSNIDFNNNIINIYDTSAFVNNAKFNLKGTIDAQTNLDLKVNSEPLSIAKVLIILKSMPITVSNLDKYKFNNGLLTINSTIKGKLEKPILNTNSMLDNLEVVATKNNAKINIKKITFSANPENNVIKNVNLNAKDIALFVEKKKINAENMNLQILENEIKIPSTKLVFENIPLTLNGQIKNYKKQPEAILNISSLIPKKHKYFNIENNNLDLKALVNIKQDKLIINSCNLTENNVLMASLSGLISNISKKPLSDIKILINNDLKISFPEIQNINLLAKGNLDLKGEIQKPNVSGRLYLNNIKSNRINLFVNNAILDLKNSVFHLDIKNGKIFDVGFDLATQGKYFNEKLVLDFANFNSNYVNLTNFEKYNQIMSQKSNFNYEIDNIRGNISAFEANEILINNLSFDGKIKNDILKLSNISGDLLNGKISGGAEVELASKKVKTEFILKELNVRLLSDKLKELSIATSGKLSAVIKGSFKGCDINEIISNFDGNIKFNIENGELSQFAKLERFLQAGNILSQSILKFTLNSAISALSKQNTGDFKNIEGDVNIKDGYSVINYITTQGSNMSLYLTGYFNMLNTYSNVKILGRIPISTVNVMGKFGKFSLDDKVQKMNTDTKETIQTIASSPIEKKFSIKLSDEELLKIPPLAYQIEGALTREFIVLIDGVADNINSIISFKWHSNQADL